MIEALAFWTAINTPTSVDALDSLLKEEIHKVKSFARDTGSSASAHSIVKGKPEM